MDEQDKPLGDDIAEIEREGQKLVDRNIAARAELEASNKALDDYEANVAAGAERALAYVKQYRNPTQANPPAPLAADVAAPAPAEEPPVFTSVESVELTPDSTSGGFAAAIGESFVSFD